jgi:CO/xanthine dehydrogenase FAD-binding subunit
MIVEYHRPRTLEETLALLARPDLPTLPLGGGTVLSRPSAKPYAVVDLQALGLNLIENQGNMLAIGATVTLQSLFDCEYIQPALREAIRHETSYNLRQVGTVAGTIVAAKGNTTFTAALMALDAKLIWAPGEKEISLGDYMALRENWTEGKLLLKVVIPLNVDLRFEKVARTPADQPILSAAAGKWSNGRTRIVLGGLSPAPWLVKDGQDENGLEEAIKNAHSHFYKQPVYSEEYLINTSRMLIQRLLNQPLLDQNPV